MFDWLFLYLASFVISLILGCCIAPGFPLGSSGGTKAFWLLASVMAALGALLIMPGYFASSTDLPAHLFAILLTGGSGAAGAGIGLASGGSATR